MRWSKLKVDDVRFNAQYSPWSLLEENDVKEVVCSPAFFREDDTLWQVFIKTEKGLRRYKLRFDNCSEARVFLTKKVKENEKLEKG